MNAAAVTRWQNAYRVTGPRAARLHSLTRRKRMRDMLSGMSATLKFEIIVVVAVGALLFIH